MKKSFEPIFKKELFDGMVSGINKTADAVGLTLGPNGRTVLSHLNQAFGSTKDGVTVAKTVALGDKLESLGQKLLLDAANSTVNQAGDGTTTSVVFSRELILRSLKMLDKGHRFLSIKKGYQDCRDLALKYIDENRIEVSDNMDLLDKVAVISANNDHKLGTLVSGVVSKIGEVGIVECELSYDGADRAEFVKGYRFDKGYSDSQFMGHIAKQELENCRVLIVGDKDFNPLDKMRNDDTLAFYSAIDDVRKSGDTLLIVGFKIDPSFMSMLVSNTGLVRDKTSGAVVNNRYWVNVINIPYYDEGNVEYLRDIATITGATILCEETGAGIYNFNPSLFGMCNKVVITATDTTFVDGQGNDELIQARAKALKDEAESHLLPKFRDMYMRRYSFLTAGAAKIWFSGDSDGEKREKYDRLEDCIRSVKSAMGKGILPGGGSTMLKASEYILKELGIKQKSKLQSFIDDIKFKVFGTVGDSYEEAVREYVDSMRVPFRKIMRNSYYNDSEIKAIENTIVKNDSKSYGYNALTGKFVDLIEDGVVDAALVTISSIKNATSVTEQFVTSGCAIVEVDVE